MKKLNLYLVGAMLVAGAACTSLSTGQDANLTGEADPNRRVYYRGNPGVPTRQQMDEQSSEINRKRNIEETGRTNPATTAPELRPQRMPDAPVDSTRHNVQRPVPFKVEPIDNRE